jgi:chromosomal replication initiation ATPase DnaA
MKESSIKTLIKTTEIKFDVNLRSNSRKRKDVYLRAILINTIYKKSNYSLGKIGSYFNRHHSSIIHALKVYELNKQYDDFKALENQINKYQFKDLSNCNPCTINYFSLR